jgi:ABC-type dipeptide/oligopeptide/nickel transport system permease subunit
VELVYNCAIRGPVSPGLMIFTAVLSFNLFGNAIRDALDPRLR